MESLLRVPRGWRPDGDDDDDGGGGGGDGGGDDERRMVMVPPLVFAFSVRLPTF
ncbi:hypothetical protein SLEP1_g15776 [Rubroshorea leprosula]|uniref:Uncharacterized protein n=1 Tax=Rubroshorea leprosula TaxID=152421 RepID=A0AAV5INM2_9ROSI|nr:hypothetical protein SLEP1_g15776 [Rubroshorea leprosula]